MRELTSHKVNGLNEALRIEVTDEPGQGNACHQYKITTPMKSLRTSLARTPVDCEIDFQCGPIQDVGVNGVSNEALLAIVEDRLLGFQSGEFACYENARALMKLQEALMWLHKRTHGRVVRCVEGTNEQ
jgi:hypothetical protein